MDDLGLFIEIPNYPGYRINKLGILESCWSRGYQTNYWIKIDGHCTKCGYIRLHIRNKEGKSKHIFLHNLIMESFVGPKPYKMTVCHNNGKPQDNKLSNLRYDTQRNNNLDKIKHGTMIHGEKCKWCTISDEKIREIRQKISAGIDCKTISKLYNIKHSYVSEISTGKARKEAGGPLTSRYYQARKLNEIEARNILLLKHFGYSNQDIIKEYKLSKTTYYNLIKGRTYQNISKKLSRELENV